MGNPATAARHKILLVDDDQDFLEVYWEVLQRLPSRAEVHTATTGARALALLESEPFTLLMVDIHMPKMDGLQLVAIARRKFPQLRIVVLTGVDDEQFRARAYGMGVDQFWQKPDRDKEVEVLLESVEALLHHEAQGGFRGMQSKSLVDIIQFECMSQASGVLRITNGQMEGRIWMQAGAVIDAEAQELKGEAAFRRLLGWKTGSFEMLAPEPDHPRVITVSYQTLLLESAQVMDEAAGPEILRNAPASGALRLSELTQLEDVQFVLSVTPKDQVVDSWGLESPHLVSDWSQNSLLGFQALGERLRAGILQQVTGLGTESHVVIADSPRGVLTVGFRPSLHAEEVRRNMKSVLAKWVS